MTFEFATAGRVVFGRGSSRQVPEMARGFGRRALVVLGGSGRGRQELAGALAGAGVDAVPFLVDGEPTTRLVDRAAALARAEGCDLVIARGGGSAIDAGKAAAGLAGNPGEVLDYLEVVGGGRPLPGPGLPVIAVPTTAGTGAEVTRNAVLDVPEHRVKVSLRSPHLLPRLAVVDPGLTDSMPPRVTAFTGMDALTQLIEPFISNSANPLSDALCREGMAWAAVALPRAFRDGSDMAARDDMALASLFGGIALANAKLGAVHGFASVLGGATGHPHGALCARLLPFVVDANIRAAEDRGDPATLRRLDEVARIVTGDPSADARVGAAWLHRLSDDLAIPPLREAGLSAADIPRLVPPSRRASSMRGNPVELNDEELAAILENAL